MKVFLNEPSYHEPAFDGLSLQDSDSSSSVKSKERNKKVSFSNTRDCKTAEDFMNEAKKLIRSAVKARARGKERFTLKDGTSTTVEHTLKIARVMIIEATIRSKDDDNPVPELLKKLARLYHSKNVDQAEHRAYTHCDKRVEEILNHIRDNKISLYDEMRRNMQ